MEVHQNHPILNVATQFISSPTSIRIHDVVTFILWRIPVAGTPFPASMELNSTQHPQRDKKERDEGGNEVNNLSSSKNVFSGQTLTVVWAGDRKKSKPLWCNECFISDYKLGRFFLVTPKAQHLMTFVRFVIASMSRTRTLASSLHVENLLAKDKGYMPQKSSVSSPSDGSLQSAGRITLRNTGWWDHLPVLYT